MVGAMVYVAEEARMKCSRIGPPSMMRRPRRTTGMDGVRSVSAIWERFVMVGGLGGGLQLQ